MKELGDEASLERLQAFADKHHIAACIAQLSKEQKLAVFGDMLLASKQVAALEATGEHFVLQLSFDVSSGSKWLRQGGERYHSKAGKAGVF